MILNPEWLNEIEKFTKDIRDYYEKETDNVLDFSKPINIKNFIEFYNGKISYDKIYEDKYKFDYIVKKPKKEDNKLFEIVLDYKHYVNYDNNSIVNNETNILILKAFFKFAMSYIYDRTYNELEYDGYIYPNNSNEVIEAKKNIEKRKNTNVFEYKYDLDSNGAYKSVLVPYYIKEEKINNITLKKNIIVDIRNIDYNILFENYKDFQEKLLSPYFYNNSRNTNTPDNIRLYFLCKDNNEYINRNDITNDKTYALKYFIKESDLSQIKEGNINILPSKEIINVDGHEIELSNFNLIYGLNDSGKTKMIKSISNIMNVPLFDINFFNKIYLTDSKNRLNNLKNIINYCELNRLPLLIDNIFWDSFSFRNKIKIVDDLYDYSLKEKVVVTGFNDSTKSLIKSYTHNPNIINVYQI